MNKFPWISAATCAVALLTLSACAGSPSDLDQPKSEKAIPTTPAPQLSLVDALPIEVFPEVGTKNGVVTDPTDASKLVCEDGTVSIPLYLFKSVAFNGTLINMDANFTKDDDNNPQTGFTLWQTDASVTFKGDPAQIAGMIVKSSNGYIFDNVTHLQVDSDRAVNLTADMLGAGVMMKSMNFVGPGNYINSVVLCATP